MATWVNVQGLSGVSIVIPGAAGLYYTADGDLFFTGTYTPNVDAAVTTALCANADEFGGIEITLPVGINPTGRQRITVVTNTLTQAGPNYKIVHQIRSETNGEPAPGEYILDPSFAPCLVGGGTVYTRAGTVGSGGAAGAASWRLEIELDDPVATEFWTDIVLASETF